MPLLIAGICLAALLCLIYFIHIRRKASLLDGNQSVPTEEEAGAEEQEKAAEDQEAGAKDQETDLQPSAAEPAIDEGDEKALTQNRLLIEKLHRVLEEDMVFLRPDIHIDDVAKLICSNRTYVTRLMRQEYGLTFIEYVNVARIQYSQKLLYSSNKTLDEIAELSGFQSTSNYCRAFKRYIGTSPLAWLESVK